MNERVSYKNNIMIKKAVVKLCAVSVGLNSAYFRQSKLSCLCSKKRDCKSYLPDLHKPDFYQGC